MRSWEACERRIAEELNGFRVPVSGRARGDVPDIEHPHLSIEVKSRKRLPAWLEKAVSQAEAAAEQPQLPVAVLYQDGRRYQDALVVLRLQDFEQRLGFECISVVQATNDPTNGPKPESVQREESLSRPVIEVWTDGGCRGNPGKGAWAVVIYDGPKPKEMSGAESRTTNNRQELRAAIEALKALEEPRRIRLHSDSGYLVDAFNKDWISKWKRNRWRTAKKKPVQNADLWRELAALTIYHEVKFVKVAGHAGIPANERCHALVQLAIERVE